MGVDRDEFRNLMAKEETKQQFALLELPFGDAEVLFDLLDEENAGEIGIATFVEGAMKLKGQAKAKDLMEVVVKLAALVNRVHRMEGEVDGLVEATRLLPSRIRSAVDRAFAETYDSASNP